MFALFLLSSLFSMSYLLMLFNGERGPTKEWAKCFILILYSTKNEEFFIILNIKGFLKRLYIDSLYCWCRWRLKLTQVRGNFSRNFYRGEFKQCIWWFRGCIWRLPSYILVTVVHNVKTYRKYVSNNALVYVSLLILTHIIL